MDITELLAFSAKQGASDLHLSAGLPPMIRVDGDVRRINLPPLEHREVHALVYEIMNDKQRKDYEEFLETDFSFEVPGVARFRVNAFNQNRGAGAVFRTIPSKVLTMEDLGMGQVFKDISMAPRGLVLVTGPTGSGKSTTLAAMVDFINDNRYQHILTIEDPIEFVHESKKCLVNQREVHRDTHGFSEALRVGIARRPRHHSGRRDARPDHDPPRADRRGNRTPGVRHAAHDVGVEDDRPDHRPVPGRRKRHGAVDAVRVAAGGDFADAVEARERRARRRARNHDRARRRSVT